MDIVVFCGVVVLVAALTVYGWSFFASEESGVFGNVVIAMPFIFLALFIFGLLFENTTVWHAALTALVAVFVIAVLAVVRTRVRCKFKARLKERQPAS